jgi:PAS domain S-box-containing protein
VGRTAQLVGAGADRLREAEALLAVSTTVNSTLEVPEALRLICRELARLLGADTAAAYRHDGPSDQLVPVAGYHVPKELMQTLLGAPLPLREQGFYAPIWQERRPVLSNDVAADPRFSHDLFRRFPHQSGLVLPLVLDERVAGAFYLVWWTARRQLTERERELMASITAQVTVLLKNARRFEKAERERLHLGVMYALARRMAAVPDAEQLLSLLVEEAAGLLGAEAAGIRLLEGDELVLSARTAAAADVMMRSRIKVGESLTGRVVSTGEPLAIEDLVEDRRLDPAHIQGAVALGFHGFLGVPLTLHGRVIGALNVYTKPRRAFTKDDVSLLSALADQASIAITKNRLLRDAEDARAAVERLYAESHAREQEATKLYEITSQLASSLDVDVILDQIVGKTVDLLGSDAAGIYTYDERRGGLTFRRGLNLDPNMTRHLVLEPGEGVAGRAYAQRRPVWTGDRLADAALVYTPVAGTLVGELAPRAYLAVPIIIRGEVLGVLVDYFFAPHAFSPKEVQLLSTLADHAAIALDNARHYAEARTQQTRLAQIFASTSDAIVLVSRSGRIEAVNGRAGELLGFDPDRVIGLELVELMAGCCATADYDAVLTALGAVVEEPDREAEGDLCLHPRKDILRWVARPTRSAAGETVGATLTLRDVTREREVSQMKSDFVSFVTHQLRTPLAGLKWMLELAAKEPALPADAASFVQDARDAAERLIGLVNNLLDVSRLERGKLTLALQDIRIGVLTRSVLDEMSQLIQDRGHRLSIAGDADVPPVRAEPQLLRQVLLNLVSNAVKFTPPGGTIAIAMGREGRLARWAITDSGIGIPEASRARLFEKFYRAENVTAIETEGTGLGLYLVRLTMEQLGGQVTYVSEEGKGSTFVVTLPIAA